VIVAVASAALGAVFLVSGVIMRMVSGQGM